MKNTDQIIKYLSGEMSPVETNNFQAELATNPELKSEFESISLIWKHIKKQLKLLDGTDTNDREEYIAEILAEHDISIYGQQEETTRENEFRRRLKESMIKKPEPEKQKALLSPRVYSMVALLAAAMITAVVLILNPSPDISQVMKEYYQPGNDGIFEKLNYASRSEMTPALALFKQGNFDAAKVISKVEMEKSPDVLEIHLLYALACFESGDYSAAVTELEEISQNNESEIVETSQWYLALIYLKSTDVMKAREVLNEIISEKGKYRKNARRLLRKME